MSQLYNAEVEQRKGNVIVKRPGTIYKLPVINETTVCYHSLRELPQWVKDALVLRTTYNSIHNGEP